VTSDQKALLEEIESTLAQNDAAIQIPLTRINQGIAALSKDNAKIITKLQGKILRQLNQHVTDASNQIDGVQTTILQGLQNWQNDNRLLLTQLAAKTGLTAPGDSLEMALVDKVADAPELAYSATLLLAIREAFPFLRELIEVLQEIRDRMPNLPVHVPGEPYSRAPELELGKPVDAPNWQEGPRRT
jgi:hypothetical protein